MKQVSKYQFEFIRLFLASLTLGLLAGLIYYATAPKTYQAVGLISMQFASNNESAGLGDAMTKIVGRFSSPGAFSPTLLAKCKVDIGNNAQIASMIRFEPYRGAQDIFQVKVNAASINDSVDCGNALFEEIKKYSAELSEYIVSRLNKENALNKLELNRILAEFELSSQKKDQKKYVEIFAQERQIHNRMHENEMRIMLSQQNSVFMLAPFFAGKSPTSPKISVSICFGLLGGGFFSFLIAAYRERKRFFYHE